MSRRDGISMGDTRTRTAWTAPLLLGAALAAIGTGAASRDGVRSDLLRVDPGRDPAPVLTALEGMGPEAARRIVAARRAWNGIRSASDLLLVPGIGARRVHRWSDDLDFAEDRR